MFRLCFATVEQEATLVAATGIPARVLILSARHGLIDPDTEITPYEQTMTAPGAVAAWRLADQLAALTADRDVEIITFLPKAYLARLRDAVDLAQQDDAHVVHVHDAYAAAPGIGHQRRVLAQLRQTQTARQLHRHWSRRT